MKSRATVAVIGLGMGSGHASAAAENSKADLAALCDIDKKRLAALAEKLGVEKTYTDYRKLLREVKPKIAIVALPNYLHKRVTVAALDAGAHVFCEKPMAMNTREAQKMLDTAKARRKKLMINFSFRFTPQARALKNIAASGALGDVYYARTRWCRNRGIPGFGGWFGQKKLSGGGPLIDLGVHRIDLAMWLMGSPRPVAVCGNTYDKLGSALARKARKKFDVEDLAVGMVRFDNGASLLLEASWAMNSEKGEDMVTCVYGTKAGICHRNVGEGYEFEAHMFEERAGTYVASKIKRFPPSPSSIDHFIEVVVDGAEPVVTPQQGVDVMKVLDGLYKSARLGREVRL